MIYWLKTTIARPWWTMLKKNLATLFGRPYFKVFIFEAGGIGKVGIDAHYNIHFLYRLDAAYEAAGSDIYERSMDEQAKISIYLYDTLGGIAENYAPMPDISSITGDDIGADVPPLAFRGGEEVRQVVDLAQPQTQDERPTNLDIQMG